MKVTRRSSCSRGDSQIKSVQLSHGDKVEDMNVLNKVALLPQTDYELVLTTGAAVCSELFIDAVVWADVAESKDFDVEIARRG